MKFYSIPPSFDFGKIKQRFMLLEDSNTSDGETYTQYTVLDKSSNLVVGVIHHSTRKQGFTAIQCDCHEQMELYK